jgi:hypothetical protein
MRAFVCCLIVLSFILIASPEIDAASGLDNYKARRAERLIDIDRERVIGETAQDSWNLKSSAFADTKLNTDSDPERFDQRYSDVAVFPDGGFVVVWEDDRNGDYDIYAQVFNSENSAVGGNVRLIFDAAHGDQRMASCDTYSSGNLVVAWIDSDGSLYGQVFDENLAEVTESFKVNDNAGENVCNLPDVVWLQGGGLVFVWEDSRNGDNIYAQIYTSAFGPLGGNFRLNVPASNSSFWSPSVTSGGASGFAVAWEEITSIGASVVMKTYTAGGSEISGLISLPDPAHGADDQFQAAVAHLDEAGYVASWIDTRNSAQAVYAQIVDYNGYKNGSNFILSDNPDYVCWDVMSMAAADGSILATWASYGERAEILGTRLDNYGDRDGVNITISDPVVFNDRYYPQLGIGDDNLPVVVWTDLRDGEQDTYFQRLSDSGTVEGSNVLVPSIASGAQQVKPDIALLSGSDIVAVWQDGRYDCGDIYFQRANGTGNALGSNQKVNQDIGATLQSHAAVGASADGKFVIAWQDARTSDGLAGINIFARRYGSSGTPLDAEMILTDDTSTANMISPNAAYSITGRSIVAWEDATNGDIYAQQIASNGSLYLTNTKINTDPSISTCGFPKVCIDDNTYSVVAWLGQVGERKLAFFQRINPGGTLAGGNTLILTDTAGVSHEAVALANVPSTGDFVVAWEGNSGARSILARRFNSSGDPQSGYIAITSSTDLVFSDLTVATDASGYIVVGWTDSRTGVEQAYMVIVTPDDIAGSIIPVSQSAAQAREGHLGLAVDANDVYAVWHDNRNMGSGFDIFANTYFYGTTGADDPGESILPGEFTLAQNYPNPFNPTTTIRYYIPNSSRVTIDIVNLLGSTVEKHVWERMPSGWHEFEFNASGLASSVYFYRISAGDLIDTRKMVLLK